MPHPPARWTPSSPPPAQNPGALAARPLPSPAPFLCLLGSHASKGLSARLPEGCLDSCLPLSLPQTQMDCVSSFQVPHCSTLPHLLSRPHCPPHTPRVSPPCRRPQHRQALPLRMGPAPSQGFSGLLGQDSLQNKSPKFIPQGNIQHPLTGFLKGLSSTPSSRRGI